jgi:hypothetical protein
MTSPILKCSYYPLPAHPVGGLPLHHPLLFVKEHLHVAPPLHLLLDRHPGLVGAGVRSKKREREKKRGKDQQRKLRYRVNGGKT